MENIERNKCSLETSIMNYISCFAIAMIVTGCAAEESWFNLYKKVFEGPQLEPAQTLEFLKQMFQLEPKDGFLGKTSSYWLRAIESLIKIGEVNHSRCAFIQIEDANYLMSTRYNDPSSHANLRKYLTYWSHELYRVCRMDWKITISLLTDQQKSNLNLLKNIVLKEAAAANFDFTITSPEVPEAIISKSFIDFFELKPEVLFNYLLKSKGTIRPQQFGPLFDWLVQDLCGNSIDGLLISMRVYLQLVDSNDSLRHEDEDFIIEWLLNAYTCKQINANKVFIADKIHTALLEGNKRLNKCVPRGIKFKKDNYGLNESDNSSASIGGIRSYIPFLSKNR